MSLLGFPTELLLVVNGHLYQPLIKPSHQSLAHPMHIQLCLPQQGPTLTIGHQEGCEQPVSLVLGKGAIVRARDEEGWTVDCMAANRLLEKGVDLNDRSDKIRTALHWVAMCGHEVKTKLPLDKGVDIGAGNDCGRTVLHEAAATLLLEKEVGGLD